MKQEDKDLLLRDLCARLPYGVKVQFRYIITSPAILKGINKDLIECDIAVCEIQDIKPYLFPLSSMTEEQYESLRESGILSNCSHSYEYVNPHIHGVSFIFKEFKTYSLELIKWLNKHHFDYRGLIPIGLANDATDLNIY